MQLPALSLSIAFDTAAFRAGLGQATTALRTAANDMGRAADRVGDRLGEAGRDGGRDFAAGIRRGVDAANTNLRQFRTEIGRTATAMEGATGKVAAFASNAKTAMAGAAAAAAGAAATFRTTVTGIANIGNEARRAGLQTKAFQELSFVARQTRVPIDALVDGMKELNLRGDEFAKTGKGSAAESFQRLGFSAEQLTERLKDPVRLFTEIIQRMQGLSTAGQVRVFDELFGGTGGEQFMEFLRIGPAGIAAMVKEANDLGAVLGDDVIKRADEMDRKFGKITDLLSGKFKTEVVRFAEDLNRLLDEFNSTYETTRGFIGRLGNAVMPPGSPGTGPRTREVIEGQIRENSNQRSTLAIELQKLRIAVPDSPLIKQYEAGLIQLSRQEDALREQLRQLTDTASTTTSAVQGLGAAAAGAAASSGMGSPSFRDAETASMGAHNRQTSAERRKSYAELADKGDLLGLISLAEGTGPGSRGYNETLDRGRWTGGNVNLTGMTINEVLALQDKMRTPENRRLYGNGQGSSAVGKYQIVGKTLRGLKSDLGLTGDEYFDAEMQDRMARQLLRGRRGQGVDGLFNEWEGPKKTVPRDIAQRAIDNYSGTAAPVDEGVAETARRNAEEKKRGEREYKDSVEESRMALVEQGQALMEQSNPLIALQRRQAELQQMYQQGAIDHRTYLDQMRQAELDYADEKKARDRELMGETAEAYKELQGSLTSALDGAVDGLASLLTGGKFDFKSWIQGIAKDIASIGLKQIMKPLYDQIASIGTGMLGGKGGTDKLGTAKTIASKGTGTVAGFYASGTDSAARGMALVGERGPEVVFMGGGEKVANAGATARMRGGGVSGGSVSNITVNVNGQSGGSSDPAAQRKTGQLVANEVRRVVQEEQRRRDYAGRRGGF